MNASIEHNDDNGFNRFGRIIDHKWNKYAGAPTGDVARIKYGYDAAGNRDLRQDVVAASNSKDHDEFYTYDGLHRLTNFDRGSLTGTFPRPEKVTATKNRVNAQSGLILGNDRGGCGVAKRQ